MYHATLDSRHENLSRSFMLDFKNLEELKGILQKLDGKRHTIISINHDNQAFLIGGGPKNFIVTKTIGDENTCLTSNTKKPEQEIEICAGGQFGHYPQNISCSFEEVIFALNEEFFSAGCKKSIWL